jgi:hypothetical protein
MRFGRSALKYQVARESPASQREIEFGLAQLGQLGVFTASAIAASSKDVAVAPDGSVESGH